MNQTGVASTGSRRAAASNRWRPLIDTGAGSADTLVTIGPVSSVTFGPSSVSGAGYTPAAARLIASARSMPSAVVLAQVKMGTSVRV